MLDWPRLGRRGVLVLTLGVVVYSGFVESSSGWPYYGLGLPDPVGYWTFDGFEQGNEGLVAADQYNNIDAIWRDPNGQGLTLANGIRYGAAQIDGTSSFKVDLSGRLDGATGLTLSGWFNASPAGQIGTAGYKGLITSRDIEDTSEVSSNYYGLAWESEDHFEARVSRQGYDSPPDFAETDTWRHVAMSWDGVAGEVALFVDGQAVDLSTDQALVGSIVRSGEWTIGDDHGVWQREFRGLIDEVGVWDQALSADEIADYYALIISPIIEPPCLFGLCCPPNADCPGPSVEEEIEFVYANLRANFLQPTPSPISEYALYYGDIDRSGFIDLADFRLLKEAAADPNDWGLTQFSVPEPTGVLIIVYGAVGLIASRRG